MRRYDEPTTDERTKEAAELSENVEAEEASENSSSGDGDEGTTPSPARSVPGQ